MAYENITFKMPNMTVIDGYFYTMDHDEDILIAKVDDGGTAFSYPLSYPLTAQINSLEYDGRNFWSMNDISGGVSIKRWQLENHICTLKDTFNFFPNYDSDAFTVSYYNTTLTSTVSGGQAVLNIDLDYDDLLTSSSYPTSIIGKTSSQSSTYSVDYPPAKAHDDDTGTFNHTNSAAGEWWKVDLGATYDITRIRLRKRSGYGGRPQDYYIQSADDYAFTVNVTNLITANSETSTDISYYPVDFGDVAVRYLRVLCHTSSQYINISEFNVYEKRRPSVSIGPNIIEEYEDAETVSVSGTVITLVSGTQYDYDVGDAVYFYDYLWVFNNDGTGSLAKANAYSGEVVDTYNDSEYDSITACTFKRLTGALPTAIDALMYVKGTSVKLINPQTLSNYEIMIIDNVRANNITIITVYDIAVQGETLYRLQIEGTYYETDNSWSPYYNYVASSIRSFLDSISVSAFPVILPANARNTLEVTALVTDQYGNGAIYKPVFFTDTDNVGFMTINPAYTDVFFGNGDAISYYRAGVKVHTVNIEGTATQYD